MRAIIYVVNPVGKVLGRLILRITKLEVVERILDRENIARRVDLEDREPTAIVRSSLGSVETNIEHRDHRVAKVTTWYRVGSVLSRNLRQMLTAHDDCQAILVCIVTDLLKLTIGKLAITNDDRVKRSYRHVSEASPISRTSIPNDLVVACSIDS